MNRRHFFKMMAAGVVVAATLRLSSAANLLAEPQPAIVFDTISKTIKVNSDHTVLELYSAVQEAFDDHQLMSFPMPMVAHTPEHVRMENGWDISESSLEFLHNGTIQSVDSYYADYVKLG